MSQPREWKWGPLEQAVRHAPLSSCRAAQLLMGYSLCSGVHSGSELKGGNLKASVLQEREIKHRQRKRQPGQQGSGVDFGGDVGAQ